MTIYAGLDVSHKTTHICVVDAEGGVISIVFPEFAPGILDKALSNLLELVMFETLGFALRYPIYIFMKLGNFIISPISLIIKNLGELVSTLIGIALSPFHFVINAMKNDKSGWERYKSESSFKLSTTKYMERSTTAEKFLKGEEYYHDSPEMGCAAVIGFIAFIALFTFFSSVLGF